MCYERIRQGTLVGCSPLTPFAVCALRTTNHTHFPLNRANYLQYLLPTQSTAVLSALASAARYDNFAAALAHPVTTCVDVLLCAAERDIIYPPIVVHRRLQGEHKSRPSHRCKLKVDRSAIWFGNFFKLRMFALLPCCADSMSFVKGLKSSLHGSRGCTKWIGALLNRSNIAVNY